MFEALQLINNRGFAAEEEKIKTLYEIHVNAFYP
jgi:hypothetical protein